MTMGGVRSGSSSSPDCSPVARRRFKSRKSGTSTETSVAYKKRFWRQFNILQKEIYCTLIHSRRDSQKNRFWALFLYKNLANILLTTEPVSDSKNVSCKNTVLEYPLLDKGKALLSKHNTLQTDSLLRQAIVMHCSTCITCDGLNCTREHVISRHRWQTTTWHINKSALTGAGGKENQKSFH